MTLERFTYLILLFLLLSCSNTKEQIDNPNENFTEDEAAELSNLLNTSPDSSNIGIVEEKFIESKPSYSDSMFISKFCGKNQDIKKREI